MGISDHEHQGNSAEAQIRPSDFLIIISGKSAGAEKETITSTIEDM